MQSMRTNRLKRRSRSPLEAPPLRVPGQSLQAKIDDLAWDGFLPYAAFALAMLVLAGFEWIAVWRHLPRQPLMYSAIAVVAALIAAYRVIYLRKKLAPLRLGRDGELVVGQFLECLRAQHSARIFHDVPSDHENLDHVVLSARGFFVVETKTRSKPQQGPAVVRLRQDGLTINGWKPDRDPIAQVTRTARWLSKKLTEETGKHFPVKGVVMFPGWTVEPMDDEWRLSGKPWVVAPRLFPDEIARSSQRIPLKDVKRAASALSRYVRAKATS